MAELQFKIDQTALNTVKNTEIGANFEEMKVALTEFAEPYKNVIVTEDAIGIAKSDRAKIRSVSKHIDDYRKSVKAVYTEPLKQFEAKCKELTAICDEAALNIDTQVKAYEQKRKEEKLFLLNEYFQNANKAMHYPEYLSWEDVYTEKWGNVTYSDETARKDIDNACLQTDADVQSIINMRSEFQTALLDSYKQSHKIYEVYQLQERLAAQKLREEERQRKLEEQYRQERREREMAVVHERSEEVLNPEEAAINKQQETAEIFYVANFRIHGTFEEIAMVRQFLNNNGLQYSCDGMSQTTKPAEVILT